MRANAIAEVPSTAMHAGRRPAAGSRASLYKVQFAEIWRVLKTQPASFWFLNLYLFFEYVRPQQIYPGLAVLPFAQIFLVAAAISLLFEGLHLRRGYPADRMLLLFCCIVLASSFLARFPESSFSSLTLFFSWVFIYALITNVLTTEDRFLLFMLAFFIYSTKMSQHGARTFVERSGGYASWGATGAPGWFQNSGEFGIQMCIFIPLSLYFITALRRYWPKWKLLLFLLMPLSAIVSIVASSSRGAVLGLVPVVLWMLAKSRRPVKAITLVACLGVGIWLLLPSEQKERFSGMGSDPSSQARLVYWKRGIEMMNDYPATGVGYANWMPYTTMHYAPLYGLGGQPIVQVPHNIFIEAGAELGYTGLLIFIGLIGATFYTNHKTRDLARRSPGQGVFAVAMSHGLDAALVGFLAGGFFVTVLYYPFFWINYAMTVALHNIVVTRADRMASGARAGAPARETIPVRYGTA